MTDTKKSTKSGFSAEERAAMKAAAVAPSRGGGAEPEASYRLEHDADQQRSGTQRDPHQEQVMHDRGAPEQSHVGKPGRCPQALERPCRSDAQGGQRCQAPESGVA